MVGWLEFKRHIVNRVELWIVTRSITVLVT